MTNSIDIITSNPISLRVWYPRIVDDGSFLRLLDDLRHIRAERVYLFDNSYMDNYQLSPETLAERLPVLTKRISQLTEAGIVAGINSGATIGHGRKPDLPGNRMDLDWWIGSDGVEIPGIACPLGDKFRGWLVEYFRGLAMTGAREIFIDDDLRPGCHGGPPPSEWGCMCDRHLERLERDFGHKLARQELIEIVGTLSPGRVQEDWMSLWKQGFLDLLRMMERAVHDVDPSIRLGLMPVQNFIRAFGEGFLREAIDIVSNGQRPLLRTHDYHGLPHEMAPGCGLAAGRTAPPKSEHVVEIENISHNYHEYTRSPKTTRFAILSAVALGMGGAAVTFGDSERDMPWEQRYLDMLRESDPFFRTVAELTSRDTVMRGVPIRNRAYQRKVSYFDSESNILLDAWGEMPDMIAGAYGFAYRFDAEPALLIGRIPATMTPEEIRASLSKGAVIDLSALRCLKELGLADELGVEIGERVSCHRGQRFLDHPVNTDYRGDITALRGEFPVHRLETNPNQYTEVTEYVSWTGERIAGGVLVRHDGRSRTVILPHVLSLSAPYFGSIVSTQYRSLLRRLIAYAAGEPLLLSVDGPPNIKPYYFERTTDGAVIITLLNGWYDDVHDFDLLLGDGERLLSKNVYRVTPEGAIDSTGLKVQNIDGSYRLRIDRANALLNCDVVVLALAD